jgi:predicted Holliday junction resolvase-like endonuclease
VLGLWEKTKNARTTRFIHTGRIAVFGGQVIWLIAGLIVAILFGLIALYYKEELRIERWRLKNEVERTRNWRSPMECNALASQIHAEEVSRAGQLAEVLAQNRLEAWKTAEIEGIRQQEHRTATAGANVALECWKITQEAAIRADAINRSQAVSKGKITEHLVPFFPNFNYNSRDARFLGSPVDLIVFNGLSDGELKEIVFLEIKTGNSVLTTRERQIRARVQEGLVRWEELKI